MFNKSNNKYLDSTRTKNKQTNKQKTIKYKRIQNKEIKKKLVTFWTTLCCKNEHNFGTECPISIKLEANKNLESRLKLK